MSLQSINLNFDAGPIRIERMAVHPYPDLARLWVRVQLSPFENPPNVRLLCLDADGKTAAEMLLVEWREPYISLTMHLKNPMPDASYIMRVEVVRDEQLIDSKEHPFDLVFSEPPE
ncbi:MAG: hypothetical protein J5I90_09185 [Caldilineales bacterium]|nr:hypothetical protein [Caldilineales bacterium]